MNALMHRLCVHRLFFFLIGGLLLLPLVSQAASPITLPKAVYSAKTRQLTVIAKLPSPGGPLTLLHGSGGVLARVDSSAARQTFTVPLAQLGQVPCSVEVRSGESTASKAVAGAPGECKKTPVCKIVKPTDGAGFTVNEPFDFQGKVKIRDPKAKPLKYEWDFAGGTMGVDGSEAVPNTTVRPTALTGTTSFVRDNSYYRIRFTAMDARQRICESAVTVKVGSPPSDEPNFPAKVPEPAAPLRGNENNGTANDIVVLPFEDWSMQNQSDTRMTVNGTYPFAPKHSNLRAHVIKKGSVGTAKPVYLDDAGDDGVIVKYSAASNPLDPVGGTSINSTSQNWPLGADTAIAAPMMSARLQKSDWWEIWSGRPDDQKVDPALNGGIAYQSFSTITGFSQGLAGWDGISAPLPGIDQGATPYPPTDAPRTMPGKSAPYQVNEATDFTRYEGSNQWFEANEIPVTDIDDQGRVNPLPLMRVQAVAKSNGAILAATDAVLSNSRDFHCRECHAKDQIGAKGSVRSPQACQFTPWDEGPAHYGYERISLYCQTRSNPELFAAVTHDGQPSANPFDQEYAALKNMSSLHQFYDGILGSMSGNANGDLIDSYLNGNVYGSPDGKTLSDGPYSCAWNCHLSKQVTRSAVIYGTQNAPGINPEGWADRSRSNDQTGLLNEWSWTVHYFHAQLQYNADKSDIQRHRGEANQAHFPDGSIKRWDFANQGPNNSTQTGSLFPIFDDNGKQLPMEQNCLRCHAGHREQVYRDRMYTAQRTCYDCHGDMGAMGQAFKKPEALSQGGTNRTSWVEQPDCAACHTGDGNRGADKQNGFFSAGVKERAFDDKVAHPVTGTLEDNFAATPRRPDPADPESSRFAVVLTDRNLAPETKGEVLYRLGKDQHGYTGCPACHGAAHGIGPNRDPRSNDNIASIQLQGYPGHLYECNVCHTADAFNSEDSVGSVTHYPDQEGKPTILAGPHNLHPVNDPNWYYERTTGDTANRDGTRYGGWHNVWSGKPGLNREDQCAACHGADHKGTRLSKTPVDRVFDFRGLTWDRLRAVGFKSRVVKVKAGTPIGCNTCHSLETSRLNMPGETVTHRSSPRILPPDTSEFVIADGNSAFTYQIPLENPDHDALSFRVETDQQPFTFGYPWYAAVRTLGQSQGVTIDSDGVLHWPKPNVTGVHPLKVTVTDSTGGYDERWYWLNLQACANGKTDRPLTCTDIAFTEPPQATLDELGAIVVGLNAGETYSISIQADTPDHRPLSYRLIPDAGLPIPSEIELNSQTGVLRWATTAQSQELTAFYVGASDGQGEMGGAYFFFQLCKAPRQWDEASQSCGGHQH